jgi:uncharacterized protein
MKKNISMMIVLLVIAALLSACSKQEPTRTTDTTNPNSSTLANPASVYCQGLGYQEETRTNDSGQYGVCIFPDGSECDSWDFLAGRCGADKSYCAKQGYTLKTNETNIGTCVFSDTSFCDELQYFNGECKP